MEKVIEINSLDELDKVAQEVIDSLAGRTVVALDAPMGAGKTTLIRLILALLSPTKGKIEFYSQSKSVKASPATRCNLVYVPQGNTLLSGSIRDNLLLGNPNASQHEMEEALHIACADFVLTLPEGLDTICGEGGTGLSEGQAQRISIARSLLRKGRILLLDEVTSALDQEIEQQLIRNIFEQANKKCQTLIFITHRPAVIEFCQNTLHIHRNK